MKIGQGYDAHRLVEGRPLILGGVSIPYEKGLLGHSDADVLTHAIIDALLGAAGLGDIGLHFPDSDEKYKGMCSLDLLGKMVGLLMKRHLTPHNIDATVIAQKPNLSPYRDQMRENIANRLWIDRGLVNIKFTTEEGMGFTGRGEGIAAMAICFLI